MIIRYILPLQYHGICESNSVLCCSQPYTALDLLWPSARCPPEGWDIAMHGLSAPVVGKETSWARLHLPSALLTCGSPNSPRKASSQSRAFMCIATGYQQGKAEGRSCSRERFILCPSQRKREEKVAHSCSLRRCSFSPHWARTTWAWRLLREEEKTPSYHLWNPTDILFKKLDNTMILFMGGSITKESNNFAAHNWILLTSGKSTTGWDKTPQIEFLGEKQRRRGTDTEKSRSHSWPLRQVKVHFAVCLT